MIYSTIRNNRGLIGINPIEVVMSLPLRFKRNGQTLLVLTILRYNSHTFIEGTFKITPPPPTRILSRCRRMTYDCETELYVPCAFALVGEKKRIYLL
ncbi:hypothetical protein HZS_851 [Henneguya salminicola]|nr:hypothetical protein HZS_851 [Henneguya salminicola]